MKSVFQPRSLERHDNFPVESSNKTRIQILLRVATGKIFFISFQPTAAIPAVLLIWMIFSFGFTLPPLFVIQTQKREI
jgi:hypothetical protein